MERFEVKQLIDEVVNTESGRQFLFGYPEVDELVGLAAGPANVEGGYELLVMVERWTSATAEVTDALRARARGRARAVVTGPFRAQAASSTQPVRPIQPGCSVGLAGTRTAGTLGFFATLENGDKALVSNAHVLTPSLDGVIGGCVVQPGPFDGAGGEVARVSVALPVASGVRQPIDASAATIIEGISYDVRPIIGPAIEPSPQELDDATLADPALCTVSKVGRTTGLTHGRVVAVDARLASVEYSGALIALSNLILIEGERGIPFSQPGDSGSLVYSTAARRPVGLHVGASEADTGRLSFCHPIQDVLNGLGATFLAEEP